MQSYMHTMVPQHTEQYVARYGQDPYTACWPWAVAALAWSTANAAHPGWSLRGAYLQKGDADHVVAGIAETLRLSMARHQRPLGDLDIETARSELGYWTGPYGYPAPGSSGWPAPTGPYADRWSALFHDADTGLARRVARGADRVLLGLAFHTAHRPGVPDAVVHKLVHHRMRTRGSVCVALADAAPTLGIAAPVPVGDPRCYRGIEQLTVVAET